MNCDPMGDIPRIRIGLSSGGREPFNRWLINLEVATNEENEAMSEIFTISMNFKHGGRNNRYRNSE